MRLGKAERLQLSGCKILLRKNVCNRKGGKSMGKKGMKFIVLLGILAGFVIGCNTKAEEKSALAEQEDSVKVSVTQGEISVKLPDVEQTIEAATSVAAVEEKTNRAEWIYDAQNHRLTIRGTGESHDRELTEASDCDCKYHVSALPCFGEISQKKQEKIQKSIKEVVVEQGITVLNMAALADLPNLEKVTLPDSLEKIDEYVFYNCKTLKEITIPDSVISIGRECFGECQDLEKISFGKKIKSIGDGCFLKCRSLKNITVAAENEFFAARNGGLYQQKKNILYFQYDRSGKGRVAKGTKKIGTFAFADHNELREICIPASVTVIRGGAFYQCKNLRKVTFAKGSKCKKIESYSDKRDAYGCFSYCRKLAKIDLPKSLKSIGVYGFLSCNALKNVRFPEGFRFMEDSCFDGCNSLQKIYFGKSFEGFLNYEQEVAERKTFGYNPKDVREDARLQNFAVGTGSLKEIQVSGKNPFFSSENGVMYDKKKEILYMYPAGKKDASFQVPKSVRKIRTWSFYECGHLRSIETFARKTVIQSGAFTRNARLNSVKIYGKGTKIEEEAFYICKRLNSIAVYGYDSWIVSRAFRRCKNIRSVIINDKKTVIEVKAFGQSKNYTIYGKPGSDAQLFAKTYKKKFVVI